MPFGPFELLDSKMYSVLKEKISLAFVTAFIPFVADQILCYRILFLFSNTSGNLFLVSGQDPVA